MMNELLLFSRIYRLGVVTLLTMHFDENFEHSENAFLRSHAAIPVNTTSKTTCHIPKPRFDIHSANCLKFI